MLRIHLLGVVAAAAAMACGGSSSTGGSPTGTDTGSAGDGAGSETSPTDSSGVETSTTDSGGTSDGGGGGTTISGSGDGTPFDTANMALWIGAPDNPATTVVYVFSKPVKCSDFAKPGWDKVITAGTQFLEMKMFGTAPATFKVVTTLTPGPGEATTNYTSAGSPTETGGTGGTVTLTTIVATTKATGSFDLKFGTNKLTGTYDAAYCPGGVEP